jgi:hypothetical protein
MISIMMLLVVAAVLASVVVGMLNDKRHLPPNHLAVASMRASPLLRRRRSQRFVARSNEPTNQLYDCDRDGERYRKRCEHLSHHDFHTGAP